LLYHPLGRIAEAETKGIGFHVTVADDALIRRLLIAPPPFPLSESTTRTEKTFCNARTKITTVAKWIRSP